jgi:hypothetical protein
LRAEEDSLTERIWTGERTVRIFPLPSSFLFASREARSSAVSTCGWAWAFEARSDHSAKHRLFVQGAVADTRDESCVGDEKYQMQWERTT